VFYVLSVRTLTVKSVRRILELDLGFEKGGLDSNKDHIKAALDEVSTLGLQNCCN